METYPLRNVPESLWRAVKSKAASEGKTVREVILELLTKYVK